MDEKVELIGLANLPEHEQLEYMLFQIIPLADTNEMAHALLDKFGSLGQVFAATPRELASVKGVGSRTAKFIAHVPAISGIYERAVMGEGIVLDSVEKIGDYAVTLFRGKTAEEVYLLLLSANGKLLRHQRIAVGDEDQAPVYIKEIMNVIVASNASSVILTHNHTKGNVTPSPNDVDVTQKVAAALSSVDVKLLDHVIVYMRKYFSMKKENLLMFM